LTALEGQANITVQQELSDASAKLGDTLASVLASAFKVFPVPADEKEKKEKEDKHDREAEEQALKELLAALKLIETSSSKLATVAPSSRKWSSQFELFTSL
jgi:hypothetical protein